MTMEEKPMRKILCGNNSARLMSIEGEGGSAFSIEVKKRRWTRAVAFGGADSGVSIDAGGEIGGVALSVERVDKADNAETAILSGGVGGFTITQSIRFSGGGEWIEVETAFSTSKRTWLRGVTSSFIFEPGGMAYDDYAPLDYAWIPNIRKLKSHIVPDQIFRSPAVVLCGAGFAAALVPDLDFLKSHRPLGVHVDLGFAGRKDSRKPRFGFGSANYSPDLHVYFRRNHGDGVWVSPGEAARLKFHLRVSAEGHRDCLRATNAFLWKNWGRPLTEEVEPQTVPFEKYARYGLGFAMERGKLWREFDVAGARVGGTLTQTFTGRFHPKLMNAAQTRRFFTQNEFHDQLHAFFVDRVMAIPEASDLAELFIANTPMTVPPIVINHAWFNNLRTAYGFHRFGAMFADELAIARADMMKELAVAAPENRGAFASACVAADDGIFWYEGLKAFQPGREYHIPCGAWTGWWMLRWHDEIAADTRLIEKCRRFADLLLTIQQSDGSIPSWIRIDGDRVTPSPALERAAQTAAPGMFLARLHSATGDKRYLKAAKAAAAFLVEEVIPGDRWFDYETFFSCSKKSFGMLDAHFPIPPQNNLCLFWAAELFRRLHISTGGAEYLAAGRNLLDRLCLYQQVWDAPHLSINTFGGFGVMNTDAEWNDSRQSIFAETLMDYYLLTGEREYFERGVAALRSSFTLMLIDENRRVAPGNFGKVHRKDIGASYENYAHNGLDRRVFGYVMYDWGTGGAMTTAARTLDRFGDFLIDAARGYGFGINHCTVKNLKITSRKIEFDLDSPALTMKKWRGAIMSDAKSRPAVYINGARAAAVPGAGKFFVTVEPSA